MRPSSQDTQPAVTPPSGGIFQSLLEGTATPKSDAEDPLIGRTLGEYVVRRRLGVGGMGLVYEGEQPLIHRRVAIKVLKPELVQQPELLRPLLAEARAVSAVHHPGIIDIFGFGDLPGVGQYIVMEFLDGEPLDVAISRRAPFPASEVLNVLDQVLAALGAAHAAGVIHRDMKPSNVFLARDSAGATYVKLLDFGLAKHADVPHGLARQTRQSIMVGTPEYMSPEQAMGQTVGPMSDLYAVGVIAFEMLTGRLPFEGPNALAIAHSHVNDAPPRASTRAPVPAPLDDLVLQLLAKAPSERPQSAALVRERLKRMTPHVGLRIQPGPQLPMARDVRSSQPTRDGTAPTVRVRPSVDELPTLTMPTAELHARALRRSWALPIAGATALVLGLAGAYVASRGTASSGATGELSAAGRVAPGAKQAGPASTPAVDAAPSAGKANGGKSPAAARAETAAKAEGVASSAGPAEAGRTGAGASGTVAAVAGSPPAARANGSESPAASRAAPGSHEAGRAVAAGQQGSSAGKPVESRAAAAARAVGLAPAPEPAAPAPRLAASAPVVREAAHPPVEVRPAQPVAQGLPGKVRLLVKGWGNLTVDGTLLGQFPAPSRFPLNAVELKPGTHLLELANGPAQKTWRSVVNVEPGGTTELTVAW